MPKKLLALCLVFLLNSFAFGQMVSPLDIDENDLNIGGDIFSDFNEDLDSAQILEDERFYRFGRFFSFIVGVGTTIFDGNRGTAYDNDHPSFNLSLLYFSDFQNAFGVGFAFSKHHFIINNGIVANTDPRGPGLIDVSMLRVYFSYRYYVDTSDLGTAITYSNPYFIGRIEYWYGQNKFPDRSDLGDDKGGGLGFALGGGLEFPIKLKESYIGLELLYHVVNFHDKHTKDFQPANDGELGFDDLGGDAFTTMVNYVINW